MQKIIYYKLLSLIVTLSYGTIYQKYAYKEDKEKEKEKEKYNINYKSTYYMIYILLSIFLQQESSSKISLYYIILFLSLTLY